MKLLHGECVERMRDLSNGSINLVLCDPPFGTTQNKWDEIIPFKDLWESYKRIVKPGGAVVLFSSQPFTTKLIASNLDDYKYNWVWEKGSATGHLNAKKMPMKLHEDICVFVMPGGKPTYNPQGLLPFNKTIRRGSNGTNFGKSGTENFQEFTNYPRSIIKFPLEEKRVHPTQKPTKLLEYLIRTYTNAGEVVLDNTMGSGSTGVAAINTGREFIGIELDEKYFEIASNRINNAIISKTKGE